MATRPSIVLLTVFLTWAAGASGAVIFDPVQALTAESISPVVDNDVHRAHRRALEEGFRHSLETVLSEDGLPGARVMENPNRYIRAYRILEQTRLDLFYRLKILVWVDRDLVRDEAGGWRRGKP